MTPEIAVMLTGEATGADVEASDQPGTGHPRARGSGDAMAAAPRNRRQASAETERLYAADWRAFEDWCRRRSLVPLPADATTVVSFMSDGAITLSAGALSRRAAAIAAKHRQSGFASPATDPAVTAVLNEARRAATPRRPPARASATLIRMAARCPRDLAGTRDRALLLLAASGLGRSALVGLDVEHIRFTATAAELSLNVIGRRAGRRTGGQGREDRFVLRRGADRAVCAVQALDDWLDTSDTKFGPVFRKIDRWGTLEHHRLGTDAIRRILARRTLRRTAKPSQAPERTKTARVA